MRVALTGGNGFLGLALKKRLAYRADIEVIDLSRSNGFDILNDPAAGSAVPPFDAMVHMAARTSVPDSYEDPALYYRTNVIGTLNMLERCRSNQAKFIFLSSYMYGHPQKLPIDEQHPVSAVNPYGQSKLLGEALCEAYARDFKLTSVILRVFNLYGPGQSAQFLIPKILKQAAEQPKIELFDPRPKRDFVFIDDVVMAIIKSLDLNPTDPLNIFNIGSGRSYSIQEILEMVQSHYPDLEVTYANQHRPNEILDTVAEISKAKEVLSWVPQVGLAEGIRRMIDGAMI